MAAADHLMSGTRMLAERDKPPTYTAKIDQTRAMFMVAASAAETARLLKSLKAGGKIGRLDVRLGHRGEGNLEDILSVFDECVADKPGKTLKLCHRIRDKMFSHHDQAVTDRIVDDLIKRRIDVNAYPFAMMHKSSVMSGTLPIMLHGFVRDQLDVTGYARTEELTDELRKVVRLALHIYFVCERIVFSRLEQMGLSASFKGIGDWHAERQRDTSD